MGELTIIDRLKSWWQSIKNRKCRHYFKADFSEHIADGWKQSSGALQCEKCGECYTYEFHFDKQQ